MEQDTSVAAAIFAEFIYALKLLGTKVNTKWVHTYGMAELTRVREVFTVTDPPSKSLHEYIDPELRNKSIPSVFNAVAELKTKLFGVIPLLYTQNPKENPVETGVTGTEALSPAATPLKERAF